MVTAWWIHLERRRGGVVVSSPDMLQQFVAIVMVVSVFSITLTFISGVLVVALSRPLSLDSVMNRSSGWINRSKSGEIIGN